VNPTGIATNNFMLLTAGTPPAYLTSIASIAVGSFSWSRDGARIGFSAGETFTMNPDGTGKTQLTPSDDGRAGCAPSWSPDGTKMAFVSIISPSDFLQFGEIWVMDADGGNAHPI